MPCMVVVGGFWGDEGKGKIISYLAVKDQIDIGVRGGAGPNAGHTVVLEGRTFKLRMLPSTFSNKKCRLLVGAGVAVNPQVFLDEVAVTETKGRVGLDPACSVIENRHIEFDRSSHHLAKEVGSTGTGTGPCNAERVQRVARTARDFPELAEYLADVSGVVNEVLDRGGKVLAEGTQGTFLSLYHGTYPYCTSKDVTASTVCGDIGIGPTRVDQVLVVYKAYVTRVGGGPLPDEISTGEAEKRGWLEVASVTGRIRRAAPFNFELAKKSASLNSATQAAVTKLDILYPACRGGRSWSDLPVEARRFLDKAEEKIGIPVTLIGTGPDAKDLIDRRVEKGVV